MSHDHLVPLNIVVDDFICVLPKTVSVEEYEKVILKYAAVAIITREEDRKLRLAGLNSAMPGLWCKEDIFARYKAVGIFDALVEP